MKKIKLDLEKCIGCGTCAALASNTFKMNDEGKVDIINQAGDDQETLKMAIDSCPTQAIVLEE